MQRRHGRVSQRDQITRNIYIYASKYKRKNQRALLRAAFFYSYWATPSEGRRWWSMWSVQTNHFKNNK